MPSFEHHGARIYYEEFGQGFPILTFAPAGLQSVIDVWSQPSAPIDRAGPMAPGRPARFNSWAETLKDHPEATPQVLDAFCQNLYAPGFVYCVDRAFASKVQTPCLVLAGNDEAHPYAISEELSKLLPNCEFIAEWKTGAALSSAKARVKDFLAKHTPARN